MKVHQLKTWPIFFEAVLNGTKTFEFRLNDRNFQVGDKLDLMEYDPDAEGYTGRHCHRFVSYVLDANPFFDFKGHVILGLKPVEIPEITETKLTEGQKLRICELLEESLNGVRLQNYKTDDDDNLPLVDLLSTGDTILEGQEEITNIVEQIFFDMDNWAIQLKPVEIPEISDMEIETYFKQWDIALIKTADKQYKEWLNKYKDELIDSAIIGAKWYREELKKRLK